MTSKKQQAYLEMLEPFIVGVDDEDDDNFDGETPDLDQIESSTPGDVTAQLRIMTEETAQLLVDCEGDGIEEQYCQAIRRLSQELDGESKKKLVIIGLICSMASDECHGGRRASFYIGDMHKLFEAMLTS